MKQMRLMGVLLPAIGIVLGTFSSESLHAGSVNKIGMLVEWQYRGSDLILSITGPSKGWVLAGFNNRNDLQNARLFFATIRDKHIHVEEHRTDLNKKAPFHINLRQQTRQIQVLDAKKFGNQQKVTIKVPVKPAFSSQINLNKGQSAELIIAYSNSHDFFHHSASRTSIRIVL